MHHTHCQCRCGRVGPENVSEHQWPWEQEPDRGGEGAQLSGFPEYGHMLLSIEELLKDGRKGDSIYQEQKDFEGPVP